MVDILTGTNASVILINQIWSSVCFCRLSRLQYSCIHHKYCYDRALLRPGRFYTGQETCAAARSPTSAVEAPPPRCNYINKLPPANVEKCPIPISINEILRCGVKVSWLGIFCILVFFCQRRDLNPSLSSSLNKDLQSQQFRAQVSSSLYVRSQWWKRTHKNVNE